MAHGCHRMVPQHAGTGIAHHTAHPFPHVPSITMHRADTARTLPLPERAMLQTQPCIFQQLPALGTQNLVPLFAAAIEADHLFYNTFLLCNA